MVCNCKCTPHPRDGQWAWLVCISAAISNGLYTGVMSTYAIFLPVIGEQFRETREKTAWAGSIPISLSYMVGPIPVILSQRFGHRPVTIASGLLCAISLAASSFATGITYLCFSYGVLFGCGAGCILNCGYVMISKYFTKNKRSLSTGIVSSGGSIGVMIMGPTLQALIAALGWRNAYRVLAGAMLIICLAGATYDPNIEECSDTECLSRIGHRPLKLSSFIDCSLYRNWTYVAGTIAIVLAYMGLFLPNVHLVKFAKDLHIPASKAAQLFIGIGVTSIFSKILIGRVLDKRWVTPLQGVQLSVFVMGVVTVAQAFATRFIHLLMYAIAYGAASGAFTTTQVMFFQTSVKPEKSALGLGMGYLACSFFTLAGPPVAGFIADKLGSYIPSFFVIGGILLFAAVLPLVLLLTTRYGPTTIGGPVAREIEFCQEAEGVTPVYETAL